MTLDARMRSALHEAGHVVVGQVLGLAVYHARISPGRTWHYDDGHRPPAFDLAGGIAEALSEGQAVRGSRVLLEYERGPEAAAEVGYAELLAAAAQAETILRRAWSSVRELAALLAVDGSIGLEDEGEAAA